jgi:hypothetical protein
MGFDKCIAKAISYNNAILWMQPCFLAQRGGFRYSIVPDSIGVGAGTAVTTSNNNTITAMTMVFDNGQGASSQYGSIRMLEHYEGTLASTEPGIAIDEVGIATQDTLVVPCYGNGLSRTDGRVNPRVECEIPYYTNSRFRLAGSDATQQYFVDVEQFVSQPRLQVSVHVEFPAGSARTDRTQLSHVLNMSTAEDYTLDYFVCAPYMLYAPEGLESASESNMRFARFYNGFQGDV